MDRMEDACKEARKRIPTGICPWCKSFTFEINFLKESMEQEFGAVEGMERARGAAENESLTWVFVAPRAVLELAARGQPFTTDEVWLLIERSCGVISKDQHKTAMGSIMRSACKNGIAYPSGTFRKSHQITNHRREVMIWIPGEAGD